MMKKIKAKMFNKKASNPKNKPDEIIKNLKILPGQNIADIGSGGGYFSFRFAELVGNNGLVYSIDTNKDLLKFISNNAKKQKQNNIVTILANEENISLNDEKVDLIFMRNSYHHLTNRLEYIKKLKKILKPDGKIVIIDYKKRGGSFGSHRPSDHYVLPEVIIKEMETAGYKVYEQYFFLPEQSFTIFSNKC
jgi:arsenite methyltransferase